MEKYLSHNGNLLYRGDNHFVYREYTPDIKILYNDNNVVSSSATLTVNTNAINEDENYRYWKVQFDRYVTSMLACDCQINFNDQIYWMRSHYRSSVQKRHCYMGWPGGSDPGTTFTNIDATTSKNDGVVCYLTTATKPVSSNATYKYIFDSTNGHCSAYIDDVLGGYIIPSADKELSACNNLKAWQEVTRNSRINVFSNIKVGVAPTWEAAFDL